MSEPYMQFYPADYLADTMMMSLDEHGAYLKLLMCMWRAGGWIDDDDKKIAMMLGVTPARWKKIRGSIDHFFIKKDAKISQKRLLSEREIAQENRAKKVENGRKGGEAKALKNKETGLASATNSLENNSSKPLASRTVLRTPTPTPDSTSEDKSSSVQPRAPEPETELQTDFQKIFEAGVDAVPELLAKSTSVIHQWIAAGVSPELDAIPEIRRLAATNPSIRSWGFFTGAVLDAHKTRTSAPPEGQHRGRHPVPSGETAGEYIARLTREKEMQNGAENVPIPA